METKDRFQVKTFNLIERLYLLKTILLKQSLHIKNFEDRAVGSQSKEISTTWKLTSSDCLLVCCNCQFIDIAQFENLALTQGLIFNDRTLFVDIVFVTDDAVRLLKILYIFSSLFF